jgi:predicted ATPase
VRDDLPTGTVTFLFTDVEGSTKLLRDLGAESYAEALAGHRRIIREACAAHGGVEVDTQGDAFFFAFPTAPGALAAAAALTEALAPGPIRVRTGLHTGTPLLTEVGYVGDDVHRAARIGAAAHGGQVLVSASTASLAELAVIDLGEHRFKDLSAPERVYQLGADEFPPPKTLYQTNLPIPSTPFLGREREVAEVLALLSRDDVRLLTLTGPGGTGKTRLAAHAAGALTERYPDGVWWVPLASLRDPDLVLDTASHALVAEGDLTGRIGDGRMLLLLDNFEHLLQAAARLAPLLATCPNLELLVTSRERLQLQGEQVYPVPALVERDSVRLFLARARGLDPSFSANGAVARLCSRLDNLPLALELAAARTVVFTPEQLLERLGQRLDLFVAGRDADPRQHTLRATIEWSYDLLDAEEQRLFRSLSIFAGGCNYDAVEQVCEAGADTLQSLLDKSLLRRSDGELGPRYWMLETLRQFAAEMLARSSEEEGVGERHTTHYVALAEVARPELVGANQEWWLNRLEPEHGNMRVVLERAISSAPGVALELAASMYSFWHVRGHLSEGRKWLEEAAERVVERDTLLRADALGSAADLARLQGDLESATALAESSLDIARRHRDPTLTGFALSTLASIAGEKGEFVRAAALLEEAIPELRRADDRRGLAIATSNLGYVALTMGDLERAAALFEEGLDLQRETGDAASAALILLNLGLVSLRRDRPARAADAYGECLRLSARLGHREYVAYAEDGLAALAVREGRLGRALRLVASAAVLREATGSSLDPAERELHESTLEAVRRGFDLETITAAYEAARALTLDEAVAYALSENS